MVRKASIPAAILAASVAFAGVTIAGCDNNDGPLEKAGEKADKAIDNAGDQLDKAGDQAQDAYDDAKDKLNGDN